MKQSKKNWDFRELGVRRGCNILVNSFVYIVFAFISLIFCGKLAKSFRSCASPFEEGVIRNMQHLAYSLIPWMFVSCITNGITAGIVNSRQHFNFTLNFTSVVTVLLVLGLAYVFKYGAMLQKESDETL